MTPVPIALRTGVLEQEGAKPYSRGGVETLPAPLDDELSMTVRADAP